MGDNSKINAGVAVTSGVITIKLDKANYHLWLAQIGPVLRSRKLMGIVDGTHKCPSQFKLDAAGKATTELDPAYEEWQEKDQMILSWINNSLTPSVLSTVARCQTSYDSWKSLDTCNPVESEQTTM